MTDDQLLRYSRHILLDEIGIEGQQRLLAAQRAGDRRRRPRFAGRAVPGRQRGRPHHAGRRRRGRPDQPAAPGHAHDRAHRPAEGRVRPRGVAADQSRHRGQSRCASGWPARAWPNWCGAASVVLDCSDNFATRHAVNRACVAARVPLVSGAAIRFDGQLSVFDPRSADSPCYACLFPRGRRFRGRRLQQHGRVRAAGRRDRRDAGGRGAQAADRHRRRRWPGACCCSTAARWNGPASASPATRLPDLPAVLSRCGNAWARAARAALQWFTRRC